MKAKSIDFMENHKISWRNAGEIPRAFLQKILQLILEKNEKWLFKFISTVHGYFFVDKKVRIFRNANDSHIFPLKNISVFVISNLKF